MLVCYELTEKVVKGFRKVVAVTAIGSCGTGSIESSEVSSRLLYINKFDRLQIRCNPNNRIYQFYDITILRSEEIIKTR